MLNGVSCTMLWMYIKIHNSFKIVFANIRTSNDGKSKKHSASIGRRHRRFIPYDSWFSFFIHHIFVCFLSSTWTVQIKFSLFFVHNFSFLLLLIAVFVVFIPSRFTLTWNNIVLLWMFLACHFFISHFVSFYFTLVLATKTIATMAAVTVAAAAALAMKAAMVATGKDPFNTQEEQTEYERIKK